MKFLGSIKQIAFTKLWSLSKMSTRNPLFIYPTYKATKDCLNQSTKSFGRAHYQNGAANAFRHAYWNYLIAKYCTKWSKNEVKILTWTKDITDWHENAFRNRELARAMDFHNNEIGRRVFKQNTNKTQEEVLELLLQMTKNSQKIKHNDDINKNKFNLVHLTDCA